VKTVDVPDELVEFMQYVVELLDSSEEDERSLVEIDDGVQDDHGVGGRAHDGSFAFDFWPPGREVRWRLRLSELQVRQIATGGWATVPVDEVAELPSPPAARPAASARRSAPQRVATGRAMLDALVAAGFVELRAGARVDRVAAALERVALAEIDHPSRSDADRAANLVEGLVDLDGVEEVFGDELDILATVRACAG
jgi:hypothetical protein